MKKIDLGQGINILANLGVIAGIIFLAVELQQNNRMLSAQAQFAVRQSETAEVRSIVENEELADLHVRARRRAELSETDALRLSMSATSRIGDWEWKYAQIRAGNLPDDGTLLQAIRNVFENPRVILIPEDIFFQSWEDYEVH